MGTVAAKPAAVVVMVLSVGASVLVFEGICAMLAGMDRLFDSGARSDRAVLLHPMAVEESDSALIESAAMDVLAGVDEVVEASPELVGAWIHLREQGADGMFPVAVRGVTPMAFDLRPVDTISSSIAAACKSDPTIGITFKAVLSNPTVVESDAHIVFCYRT